MSAVEYEIAGAFADELVLSKYTQYVPQDVIELHPVSVIVLSQAVSVTPVAVQYVADAIALLALI